MKKILPALLLIASLNGLAQNELNIVPRPAALKMGNGTTTIDRNTVIILEGSGLEKNAAYLNDQLTLLLGYALKISAKPQGSGAIRLNYERLDKPIPGAYLLTTDKNGFMIT